MPIHQQTLLLTHSLSQLCTKFVGFQNGKLLCSIRQLSTKALHKPVMVKEIVDILHPQPGERYLDMTFGAGGHTKALLQCQPDLQIHALDRDPEAFKLASEISQQQGNLIPLLGRFSEVGELLSGCGVREESFDGVLFDVGASSMQFDSDKRGFAISKDTPLDMRMDKDRLPDLPTAADIVNTMDEAQLSEIIRVYGQDKMAEVIAQEIVKHRQHFGSIATTGQLADIVSGIARGSYRKNRLMRNAHVATKTFQALRIYVNNELNELYKGLETVHRFLKPGGICVVIVFHSLEERVVKRIFQNRTGPDKDRESYQLIHREMKDDLRSGMSDSSVTNGKQTKLSKDECKWRNLIKSALAVSEEEMYKNPRARSARIRGAIKL